MGLYRQDQLIDDGQPNCDQREAAQIDAQLILLPGPIGPRAKPPGEMTHADRGHHHDQMHPRHGRVQCQRDND